jgi:hypothetical protein
MDDKSESPLASTRSSRELLAVEVRVHDMRIHAIRPVYAPLMI